MHRIHDYSWILSVHNMFSISLCSKEKKLFEQIFFLIKTVFF